MERTVDQIMAILEKIQDPLSSNPITKMKMIRELVVDGNTIKFNFHITPRHNPYKTDLNFLCQSHIQDAFPGVEIHIHFVTIGGEEMPDAVEKPLSQIKNIIAIASGKGGVGKSTVAVNLALALKELGARVGILDADVYGPSLPTMLDLVGKRPRVEDFNGKPRIIPLEAYGMPVLSIGNVVEPEQAVVLRGPRLAGIIKQFFLECNWPALDYLLVDLPPGTGDVQLTLVQTVSVTGAVMVTTPQQVAVADAIKAMNMFLLPNVQVPILGVIENMSWFTPVELPENKYFLFGQGGGLGLAKMAETDLLGQIPLIQSIRESGDSGQPAVLDRSALARPYFMELAKRVADQVAKRNESKDVTPIVRMAE
ncbi:MAG: Mrp/NBP35 family ATP-binding protein [Saprospiraceae bacterium]|nr:Mrp/NBP35 family ATP-binding protein [Saprospiraceae bacterium]